MTWIRRWSTQPSCGSVPWHQGIEWRSRLVTARPNQPVLDVESVREKVLRVVSDSSEDQRIADLISAATDLAEQETERALAPQTWELILSGFPAGPIKLPRPPFIEIEDFTYVDGDGEEQSLLVSPAEYVVSPSGRYSKARIEFLPGGRWPSAQGRMDAVTIRYKAGFLDFAMPPAPSILEGMRLAIAEMYDTGRCDVERLRPFWRPVVDN